ncbi:hypothetical protein FG385_33230 [Amycolatopsis alkalitolerans]|uniref:Uncharacterized protein n=1 Tax=Amycolatopsis alkalitolerans TaxID=2547244 RepID=A0A5C4LS71_9PSEU|nr:hypothetical protein FG385_33230 [Amycolatopsis alkalitolerans]
MLGVQGLDIAGTGSDAEGVANSVRRLVGLTLQHTNREVLVEGPEITVHPVGARRQVLEPNIAHP